MKLQPILLFLLTMIATGCSNVADHIRFLKEHGIKETEKVPADYTEGNGWKQLGGDYVYFLDVFNEQQDPQMIYIVADKKEKKLVGILHVNPLIMVSAIAKGVTPATIVTNYEEIAPEDLNIANDMTEFNNLLRAMPEMKDFKWKNTLQNTIASGILLKTSFIYVTKKNVDNRLFSFSKEPVIQNHDRSLRDIFLSEHSLFHHDVQRLNRSVDLSRFISALGFHYETKGKGTMEHQTKSFYINDLLPDQIDFSGKGKMFFFIPFKSFTRPSVSDEMANFAPAIETFEYSHTPDKDGFPVFRRNTHFASLLEVKNIKHNDEKN
jgi:hypothetical protein